MPKYTVSQIIKTLEKLFKSNITTTKQIKEIKWNKLNEINNSFTPLEKSLIMDFRDAVISKKILEFLVGTQNNNDKESEK